MNNRKFSLTAQPNSIPYTDDEGNFSESWKEKFGGSGGGIPIVTKFNSTNWTLDITAKQLTTTLTFDNITLIFKNGILLEDGLNNDYTISGSIITFIIALENTDKITIINW